ncbi:hypothetical protein [Synechococcus sp. PCC 6312]|uniref:hypothetical protein n=1 Tax=Synechococcus sp. (strain ATCC 27167 / PCC 6312) TaxID=195253 RepID=UPI00029EFFB8|nr:hypothetical protein [Synechococcus sp. PCC 6312]AFY60319.1 hypothetical protein Syn6312_1130 [Synechococcus sp. PCC 6312]
MNRQLTTDLYEVLDMLNASEDYGFHPMIIEFLKTLATNVTASEIEAFARETFLSQQAATEGYTQEDYESSIERLTTLLLTSD